MYYCSNIGTSEWELSLDTSFQCKPLKRFKSTTNQALNTSSGQTWLLFPETSSFSSLIIIGLAFKVSAHKVKQNAWPQTRRFSGFTRLLGINSSSQVSAFHSLRNRKSQSKKAKGESRQPLNYQKQAICPSIQK